MLEQKLDINEYNFLKVKQPKFSVFRKIEFKDFENKNSVSYFYFLGICVYKNAKFLSQF